MADKSCLYSLAIHLQPERRATIPVTSGHQTHAAFLAAVRQADPGLAEMLHNPTLPLRPFTVSLLGISAGRGKEVVVSPERAALLRITLLREPIYGELMRRFLENPDRPALRLGDTSFLVTQIQATPGSSPWAGYTTWEALWENARPEPQVAIEFLSPTAFSLGQRPWGKQFHLFPDAAFVFRSLLRSWNALAPTNLAIEPDVVEEYLDRDSVILRLEKLNTSMLRYPDHPQIGFTGRVTYGFKGKDDDILRRLDTLADFAFYAGVGYKTTMGMGQVKKVGR